MRTRTTAPHRAQLQTPRSGVPHSSGRRAARGGKKRRGVVLIVVTVVILLMSLAAYGFLSMMETENMAAHARGDQLQSQAVAASGREYLASILELPRSTRPSGSEQGELATLFGNIVVDGGAMALQESERQGRFSILAPNTTEAAARSWRFGYENESAKINLARLLDMGRREPEAPRQALMNLPNMDEGTADAILDWIDPDDAQRDQGAEREYYAGLNPPRQPRNAAPPMLEELLLVKGVTREKLFGTDLNANFQIDAAEEELARQQAEGTSDGSSPWCRYLTVVSGERDESYGGTPRVQLNQPDLGVLHRELLAVLDPTWANYIVAYRQYGSYRGSGESQEASELQVDLSRPAQRRLRSALELVGTRVGIPTESDDGKKRGRRQVQVYVSPFTVDPGQMQEYLPVLLDAVTTGSGSPVPGRVNVNLAPAEVLASLPGIDLALADRIISARGMLSGDDSGRRHAVWLLTEGIVDLSTMMRLERYATTGGDVGRAQIIGYYDSRSPIARFETVVDGTDRPARQVYYKDLRRLGRGVVEDVMSITSEP